MFAFLHPMPRKRTPSATTPARPKPKRIARTAAATASDLYARDTAVAAWDALVEAEDPEGQLARADAAIPALARLIPSLSSIDAGRIAVAIDRYRQRLSNARSRAKRTAKSPAWELLGPPMCRALDAAPDGMAPREVTALARAAWRAGLSAETARIVLRASIRFPNARTTVPSFAQWPAPDPSILPDLIAAANAAAAHALANSDAGLSTLEHVLTVLYRLGPDAVRKLGWTHARLGLVAKTLDEAPPVELHPALLAFDRTGEAGHALTETLVRLGVLARGKAGGGPSLPERLPTDREGCLRLARSLGQRIEEHSPESSGPVPLGWSVVDPTVTLRGHEAEVGKKRLKSTGRKLDVREFLPFDGLEILGADATGDLIVVDPRRRTRAGTPPVVRFCHDQAVTAELEANGVWEWAARGVLQRWALANKTFGDADVRRLLATSVRLEGGP